MDKDKIHCEVCGEENMSHGAIWEDAEDFSRIVCENCDKWLWETHMVFKKPSILIFRHSLGFLGERRKDEREIL